LSIQTSLTTLRSGRLEIGWIIALIIPHVLSTKQGVIIDIVMAAAEAPWNAIAKADMQRYRGCNVMLIFSVLPHVAQPAWACRCRCEQGG